MKKRIIALLLLTTATMGCSNGNFTENQVNEIYPNALQNFYNLESYEADYTSEFLLYNKNVENPPSIRSYNIKEIKKDSQDKLSLVTESYNYNINNETTTATFLYYDNYGYYNGFGDLVKIDMSYEDFSSLYPYKGIINIEDEKPTSFDLKNSSVTYEFSGDSKIVSDIVTTDVEYLLSSVSSGEDDGEYNYTVSPLTYTVTFGKNKEIDKTETSYIITVTNENSGQKLQFNFDFEKDIINTNNVTIDIPSNLDDYELVSDTLQE